MALDSCGRLDFAAASWKRFVLSRQVVISLAHAEVLTVLAGLQRGCFDSSSQGPFLPLDL